MENGDNNHKVLLRALEIENFKSFRGLHYISPLKSFTAVVGANGSGKSNFMDAISFVMGDKKLSLRVAHMSELLHGASTGQPLSQSARVTAVLEVLKDGSEMHFTRMIKDSSTTHRINGQMVTKKTYLLELEKLGIKCQKRIFVFQGEIEAIALQTAKETTAMFEEICGSDALKDKYDRQKAAMLEAEGEAKSLVQKKKMARVTCKQLEECSKEVENFKQLKEEHRERQIELDLFCLFCIDKYLKETEQKVEQKQEDLQNLKKRQENIEELLKENKREKTTLSLDLTSSEKDVKEMESETNKKRMKLINAKEKVTELKKRLDSSRKFLAKAVEAHSAHMENIKELESALQEVEEKKAQFENQVSLDSLAEGRSVELEEEQLQEYQQLKHTATTNAFQYQQELESIKRKQSSDQSQLDSARYQISEIQTQLRLKAEELSVEEKRKENLSELISDTKTCLNEKQRQIKDLESEMMGRRERIDHINKQLEDVVHQLGEARIEEKENIHQRKKREIVEKLQQFFPGVYDRLVNMCQPIHRKYNIAITTIMGNNMEAIVVNTEKIARKCIHYLSAMQLGRESFLPIDYIEVTPLQERLRDIKQPRNVKLLYDVLHYNPPEIKKAVLFATKNTLVCETAEDAAELATGPVSCNAVTLDGTNYARNGTISGGKWHLAKKARRWDEKQLTHLQDTKVKLREELRHVRQSNKEPELAILESQLPGIELKLKFSVREMEHRTENIAQLRKDITKLNEEMNSVKHQARGIEETMSERESHLKDEEKKIISVEDEVFADFCDSIGVANIRQYEGQHLQVQNELARRGLEYEMQKNRILNQLVYEKSRETQNTVAQWEKTVKDDEISVEQAKQAEQTQIRETDRSMTDLTKERSSCLDKKTKVGAKDKEMKKCQDKLEAIAKDIAMAYDQTKAMQHKMQLKKLERHTILMRCKIQNLSLPMKRDNMDDMEQDSETAETSLEYSSSLHSEEVYEKEAKIVIDFSKLSMALRKRMDDGDIDNCQKNLQKKIDELQTKILTMSNYSLNMKVSEGLELAKDDEREISEEHSNALKKVWSARIEFEKTKGLRYDKFMAFFNRLASEVDAVYKELVRSPSGQAFLIPANPEEPYLDGITFSCMAPGKRFHQMSDYSGGEKTLAALSLLFGVHSHQPVPFMVLDEIDASLDQTNMYKVASFLRKKKEQQQIIVISHKEEFYQNADSLVGLCLDPPCERLMSKFVVLDLEAYPLKREEESAASIPQ